MGPGEHLLVQRATQSSLLNPPTPGIFPRHSLGEAATDEDSAEGVLLVAHPHRRAHIQVAEGIQARGTCELDLPGHVSKVRTLERHHQSPPDKRFREEGAMPSGGEDTRSLLPGSLLKACFYPNLPSPVLHSEQLKIKVLSRGEQSHLALHQAVYV